jgi:hypothetical protein
MKAMPNVQIYFVRQPAEDTTSESAEQSVGDSVYEAAREKIRVKLASLVPLNLDDDADRVKCIDSFASLFDDFAKALEQQRDNCIQTASKKREKLSATKALEIKARLQSLREQFGEVKKLGAMCDRSQELAESLSDSFGYVGFSAPAASRYSCSNAPFFSTPAWNWRFSQGGISSRRSN